MLYTITSLFLSLLLFIIPVVNEDNLVCWQWNGRQNVCPWWYTIAIVDAMVLFRVLLTFWLYTSLTGNKSV